MRVIRGFAVLLVAVLATASCSSDAPPPKPDKPTASAKPGTLEVKDAVFVLNPDKTATLSAKVVNGTDERYELSYNPSVSVPGDENSETVVRFFNASTAFAAGQTGMLGDEREGTQIRLAPAPAVGTKVTLDLGFWVTEETVLKNEVTFTIEVPVVARTSEHDSVVMPKPNTRIKVKDGKIVVIPGQKRAYVSGIVVASIEDRAWTLPTAVDSKGNPVTYKHQTSTGGPYGLISLKDREFRFGGPPYTTHEGDSDYFDADDVVVGEKLTLTFPFESGDVQAVFTVVRG